MTKKELLAAPEIQKIEQAIAKAESSTSAEIVVVLSRRSVPLSQNAVTLFFLAMVLGNSGLFYFDSFKTEAALFEICVFIISLFVAGVFGKHPFFSRAFNAELEVQNLVNSRAELEFYRSDIKNTAGNTGVLLYISLFERKAVVLADRAVSEVFPKDTWTQLMSSLIQEISSQGLAGGIERCVLQLGEKLSTRFPIQGDDRNELANHLLIRDF